MSQLPTFALIGIPREPRDFVAKACSLVHPVLRAMQVGSLMLDAIDSYELGTRWNSDVSNADSQNLVRWTGELKSDEDSLQSGLSEHPQRVLKGKRLCLFRKLLVDSCYPDSKVADEMAAGFPLWLVTHVGCFSIQAETTGLAHGHAGENERIICCAFHWRHKGFR